MNVAPWTVIGWLIVAILFLSIIVTPIALYVMTQRHRRWRESIDKDWSELEREVRRGPYSSRDRFRL